MADDDVLAVAKNYCSLGHLCVYISDWAVRCLDFFVASWPLGCWFLLRLLVGLVLTEEPFPFRPCHLSMWLSQFEPTLDEGYGLMDYISPSVTSANLVCC